MRYFAILIAFLFAGPALGQTWFGDGNGTSGFKGSCCSWTQMVDLNGQICSPADLVAHPTCQTITQAQFNAYVAARAVTAQVSKTMTVSAGVPTLSGCGGTALDAGATDGQGAFILPGASVITTCSVVFGSPPYTGPGCHVDGSGTAGKGLAMNGSVGAWTGFTFTLSTAVLGGRYIYQCPQ